MTGRRFSARAFLSLTAGVDSENESSDGFDEDLDRQEGDPEDSELFSGLSEIVAEPPRRFTEEESVEDMVSRYRRMNRDARKDQIALNEAFDLSLSAVKTRLPCAKRDISMFGMICKRKWEETLVIRLYNKKMSYDESKYALTSVFSAPNSPGRIYFEAASMEKVRDICRGIEFLYPSTLFYVPIEEREALFHSIPHTPTFKEGEKVRIRNGLYRRDLGTVFRVANHSGTVIVKLKSREVHPAEELDREGANQDTRAGFVESEKNNGSTRDLSRKRKRKQSRPEPYLLPRHPVNAELLFNRTPVRLFEDGFVFRDKEYTEDGYRLLEIRCDRVERIPAEVPGHEQTTRNHAGNHQQMTQLPSDLHSITPPVSQPPFLRLGNRVIISEGPMKGMKGVIKQLSDETAIITLDDNNQNPRETSSIQVEIALPSVTRIFDQGDTVKIKAGKHAGRFGVVANVEGTNLMIVDWTRNEVIVAESNYVDSFSVQLLGSRGNMEDDDDLLVGDQVIVTKGKYSGKEGSLILISGDVVVVTEDATGMQITTRTQNIRVLSSIRFVKKTREHPFLADSEEEYQRKMRERDAFKALADSIGMDLNKYSVVREGVKYFQQGKKKQSENPPSLAHPPEPWTLMLDRETRISKFWSFVESVGFGRSDLVEFSDDGDEPDPSGIKAKRRLLLKAFLTFAKDVAVPVGDEAVEVPVETTIHEQMAWEEAFINLSRNFKIVVRYVGLLIEDEDEKNKCWANHTTDGFEGKQIYIWEGHYKGRLGIVKQMNSGACRVELETPLFGVSSVVIRGQALLSKCGCTLASGEKPEWCTNIELIASLFDRSTNVPHVLPPRPLTPPHVLPAFHDVTAQGMWLFHPRIAALRKTNYFLIKIESHPDSEVSGRREGKVLVDANPPSSPLPASVLTSVLVEYNVKKRNETRTELLPVSSLAITKRPKVKGRHAVISGPRTGEVVVYVRSDGDGAQVHNENNRRDVFYVSKTVLCVIESV